MASSSTSTISHSSTRQQNGPISFAFAASKAPVPAPVKIVPQAAPSNPNGVRLKRWPKSSNQKVLTAYLEEELKNKEHKALFTEIFTAKKGEKHLILMRGVPGSGKSVLSTLLAGVTDHGIIYSADNFFTDARGVYTFNRNELSNAHGETQKKCKNALANGVSPVIIDNTNTQTFELIPYVKMAITYNYKVHVVEPITKWKSNAKILAEKNVHSVPFQSIKRMMERYETDITPEKLMHLAKQELKKEDDLLASMGSLKLR